MAERSSAFYGGNFYGGYFYGGRFSLNRNMGEPPAPMLVEFFIAPSPRKENTRYIVTKDGAIESLNVIME